MAVFHDKTDGWDADLYDGKHSFVSLYGNRLIELLAPQPGNTGLWMRDRGFNLYAI